MFEKKNLKYPKGYGSRVNLIKVNNNIEAPAENRIKLNMLVILPNLKNKSETHTKYVRLNMQTYISHSHVFPFCSISFSNSSERSSLYFISEEYRLINLLTLIVEATRIMKAKEMNSKLMFQLSYKSILLKWK